MTSRKYEHLVKPLSIASTDMNERPPQIQKFRGPGNADTLVWLPNSSPYSIHGV